MIMKSGNDTDVIYDILKSTDLKTTRLFQAVSVWKTKLSKNTKGKSYSYFTTVIVRNNQKGYGIMELLAVSISHENTPISIREKVSFTKKKQAEILKYIKQISLKNVCFCPLATVVNFILRGII